MNDDGSYNFNLDDKTDEQVLALRKKVYDYFAMMKVLNSTEFRDPFPHMKYLEKAGIMDNMSARYNDYDRLLGIDYKKKRIIIRGRGPQEFTWSSDKSSDGAIKEF